MTSNIPIKLTSFLVALALCFGTAVASVSAHNGVDHSKEAADASKIEKMEQMVVVLTQLVDLLKKKAELQGVHVSDVDHYQDEAVADELEIWVELHSNKTHVHVRETGKKETSFLLADILYTEEEEIIEAVAEKTGLTEHEVEEVIVFPSGEVDAYGDSVEEHDKDTDKDVSGIHIMSDGKVMWGNGTAVVGATIQVDGKVTLSDGRIITPAFDLR